MLIVARDQRVAGRMLCPVWDTGVKFPFTDRVFQVSPGEQYRSVETSKGKVRAETGGTKLLSLTMAATGGEVRSTMRITPIGSGTHKIDSG